MIIRDNLHFTFREVDSYGDDIFWRIVFCSREAGKTTSLELDKMLFPYINKGLRFGYVVRTAIEITEDLIESIALRINRFLPDDKPIKFIYSKKEFKDGCVSLYIIRNKRKELLGKIISLGMQLQRLKKISIPNIHALIFDEYVVNPKLKEKYLTGEWFKLNELCNTLDRFAYKPKGFHAYLCGNPYSKYSPAIMNLGVDTSKMREGARIIGNNYIVECYKLKDELKEMILNKNPLYKFDDSYKSFALDGNYVNDSHIPLLENIPEHFYLKFVFNIEGKYLGIYKTASHKMDELRFYVREIKFSEVRKVSYCFEFDDLVNGSILKGKQESLLFFLFKEAMRLRQVAFKDVNCYYLIEDIYKAL